MAEITPSLARAARELLGWSYEEVAQRAGVALSTLHRFFGASDTDNINVSYGRVISIRRAFESAGIEFRCDQHGTGVHRHAGIQAPPIPDGTIIKDED